MSGLLRSCWQWLFVRRRDKPLERRRMSGRASYSDPSESIVFRDYVSAASCRMTTEDGVCYLHRNGAVRKFHGVDCDALKDFLNKAIYLGLKYYIKRLWRSGLVANEEQLIELAFDVVVNAAQASSGGWGASFPLWDEAGLMSLSLIDEKSYLICSTHCYRTFGDSNRYFEVLSGISSERFREMLYANK